MVPLFAMGNGTTITAAWAGCTGKCSVRFSLMYEVSSGLIELDIWREGIIEFGRMEQHAFLNCQGFTISKCIKVNLQQKPLF
jgi:hypothetical protein